LDDPDRAQRRIAPLAAGAAFVTITLLSFGLAWSVWAAIRSLVITLIK